MELDMSLIRQTLFNKKPNDKTKIISPVKINLSIAQLTDCLMHFKGNWLHYYDKNLIFINKKLNDYNKRFIDQDGIKGIVAISVDPSTPIGDFTAIGIDFDPLIVQMGPAGWKPPSFMLAQFTHSHYPIAVSSD